MKKGAKQKEFFDSNPDILDTYTLASSDEKFKPLIKKLKEMGVYSPKTVDVDIRSSIYNYLLRRDRGKK